MPLRYRCFGSSLIPSISSLPSSQAHLSFFIVVFVSPVSLASPPGLDRHPLLFALAARNRARPPFSRPRNRPFDLAHLPTTCAGASLLPSSVSMPVTVCESTRVCCVLRVCVAACPGSAHSDQVCSDPGQIRLGHIRPRGSGRLSHGSPRCVGANCPRHASQWPVLDMCASGRPESG